MTTDERYGVALPLEDAPEVNSRWVSLLARGAALNLVGTVVSQASLLTVTVVISHQLGGTDLGIYAQAFAFRALLEIFSLVGLRSAAMRFVARFREEGDLARLRGTVRVTMLSAGLVAACAGAALFLLADILANDVFDEAGLETPLRWVAVSLPTAVITSVALAATQGFRSMRAFAGLGLVFEPLLRTALTIVLILMGYGVDGAMVGVFVASATTMVLALFALRRSMSRLAPSRSVLYPTGPILSFSVVSWFSSISTRGLVWADVVLLGVLTESADVGVYTVASRAVLLASLATRPLNAALSPNVAAEWQAGNHDRVRAAYDFSAAWAWRLGLSTLAIVVAMPLEVLAIFGGDLSEGRAAILILAVGALIDTQGAQASVTLNMTDYYRLNLGNNLGALISNIGLNILLVPRYGITGAAVAWSATLGVFGLLRVLQLRRKVGPAKRSPRVYVVSVLAAVVAGGLGSLVARPFDAPASLLLAAPLVLIVYAGLVRRFALLEHDEVLVEEGLERVNQFALFRRLQKRRLRAERHSWPLGREPISIDDLIGVGRRDVLVRAQFIELVRAASNLRETDPDAFLRLARATTYYDWWCEIVVPKRNPLRGGLVARERSFRQRVQATCSLVEHLDNQGRMEPITVHPVAGQPETFALVDGGHRLAYLWLSGRRTLEPCEYRVGPCDVPIDNNAAVDRILTSRTQRESRA